MRRLAAEHEDAKHLVLIAKRDQQTAAYSHVHTFSFLLSYVCVIINEHGFAVLYYLGHRPVVNSIAR